MKGLTQNLLATLERAWSRIALHDNVEVGRRVRIGLGTTLWAPNLLTVGHDTSIGRWCTIEVDGEIGSGVVIGDHVGLVGRYDFEWREVGVPVRYAPWIGSPTYRGRGYGLRLVVEDDVFIGHGATVLSGVRVGRGAVVGAGAVVVADVPPYTVVVGSPARAVGCRLPSEAVEDHERVLKERYGI